MADSNAQFEKHKIIWHITFIIAVLMVICSSIGIGRQNIYANETAEWLIQCLGQDVSNLLFIAPLLLVSAFYVNKGSRIAKFIWLGVMIANSYSYVLYCFAVHFNYLHLIYCLILGLSNFSVIYFFFNYLHEDFKAWFVKKIPTKAIGSFLILLAVIFLSLWLAEDMPAVLTNKVPESIIKNGLTTNPVHILDYTLYLPMMFIAGFMLIKKRTIAYLLAPMMLVFATSININIIFLMIVAKYKNVPSDTFLIIIFGILTVICIGFLGLIWKGLKDFSAYKTVGSSEY